MLEALRSRGDNYANVFVVDTDTDTYSVIRLATGSLYTDGNGNHSTHPLATIIKPVDQWSVASHELFDYSYASVSDNFVDEYDVYSYRDGTKYQTWLDRADELYASGWDSLTPSTGKPTSKLKG